MIESVESCFAIDWMIFRIEHGFRCIVTSCKSFRKWCLIEIMLVNFKFLFSVILLERSQSAVAY